ncbi:hypothetical protein HJG60_009212 [Phyllostomus discolor]|uniref:Uncharacterized protein n=1 Tax=Phyllostomus discolor TaxID=89673 RepID=A0A833YQP0_9CHIR|nr:hypothetical protein HJG60_009212 [Phyllostomus discolor]
MSTLPALAEERPPPPFEITTESHVALRFILYVNSDRALDSAHLRLPACSPLPGRGPWDSSAGNRTSRQRPQSPSGTPCPAQRAAPMGHLPPHPTAELPRTRASAGGPGLLLSLGIANKPTQSKGNETF